MDRNSKRTGSYRIATPKKTILVRCEFESNKYKSVFSHADSGIQISIHGYEERGRYARRIVYDEDFDSIVAVVSASDSCNQGVQTKCKGSMIHYSWLMDRNYNKIPFWAGGNAATGGCKCALDNSCVNGHKCNCDENDNVQREDSGVYEDKSLLPVTWARVGDTGGNGEELKLTFEDLWCYGSNCNLFIEFVYVVIV